MKYFILKKRSSYIPVGKSIYENLQFEKLK
jgi:hypothetical protein